MTRPSDSGASGVAGDPVWGPPIPGRQKPEWLTHADTRAMRIKVFDCKERNVSPCADPVEKWGWRDVEYIRLPADHAHYRQPQPADTVTVGRMTEAEARKPWGHDGIGAARHVAILRDLGIIKPILSPLDRFMAAHPDADRATAEKVLAWGEGE